MGDLADDDRGNGMGIVIRYENHKGKPQWLNPKPFTWDYNLFGNQHIKAAEPDEIIKMTFAKQQAADKGFNRWEYDQRDGFRYEEYAANVPNKRRKKIPAANAQCIGRHPPDAYAPS